MNATDTESVTVNGVGIDVIYSYIESVYLFFPQNLITSINTTGPIVFNLCSETTNWWKVIRKHNTVIIAVISTIVLAFALWIISKITNI